jgi:hypothetical protein
MDEKRKSEAGLRGKGESSEQPGMSKETAGSPRAGTTPTGATPQAAGTGQPGGADQGSETEESRSSYQPGQAGEGQGGPGDRTNLSGMGGPEKSNWNQDPDQGSDSES